ncbi:hypothetical protein K439DRAFT_1415626 [Ramaria rubella]|nr:hypothetical protein K439DRAFT_1415626 [Ramaria rubella]
MMSDKKTNISNPADDGKYPTDAAPVKSGDSSVSQPPPLHSDPEAGPGPSSNNTKPSILERTLSAKNKDAARRFFGAYAQTWIGLSPIWLMGEALTPGVKVGAQFKKGKVNLMGAVEEIHLTVSTSSRDIVVIVDEKLRAGKVDTTKTAEVLKAAGENAILVVSSSLEKAQAELQQLNIEYGPKIRHSVASNGRDVIIVLDKALKHPVIITGVSKFAKSQGIPHVDALLRLGSLALSKILNALPEEHLKGAENIVEEIDAAELERSSSREDKEHASMVGKQGGGDAPKIVEHSQDPYAKMKKDTSCVIS